MRCLYDGPHPCGKCPACLANRQRAFMFRLDEEKEHASFYFWLTLTYDDDHVPRLENREMCFSKDHCRVFFEKVRKRYEKHGNKFKHFLVCEYGPEATHRPHYHCLLMVYNDKKPAENFVLRREMRDFIIHESWVHGHVTEKAFHGHVLSYLTKYCTKPDLLGEKHTMKPFTLISRGIGLGLLDRIPEDHKRQMINSGDFTYRYNGGKIQLPRYYVDRIAPHSKKDIESAAIIALCTGDWSEYDHIKSLRERIDKKHNALSKKAHLDVLNPNLDAFELLDLYNIKDQQNDYAMSLFRAKCKKRKNL